MLSVFSRRQCSALIFAALMLTLGACGSIPKLASENSVTGGLWAMKIMSPAFKPNKPIPIRYTADGAGISPPLIWSPGSDGTAEFVLIVEDPDASNREPAVQWLIYRLPPNVTSLAEGAASMPGLTSGKNYLGKFGYAPPNPADHRLHHYYFQIFALSEPLTLEPGADKAHVIDAMDSIVLTKGRLIGTYER